MLLPKAALSQVLLDEHSPGGDLEGLPSHISGAPLLAPWPTNDFVVSCDGRMSLQDQQLCQQPQR